MSDNMYPAGPAMVKIDGSRIRAIREEKGLTQLYVATAVEVTTDTVSRWENKRYPTIKKENGLKLAEALEVELSEILDSTETSIPLADEGITAADPAEPPSPTAAEIKGLESLAWYRKPGHLSILIIILVLAATGWFALRHLPPEPPASRIEVRRIVSPHFIAGRPLPVFLQITNPSELEISIILKEDLPPGTAVGGSFPLSSGSHNGTIKWLTKISGSSLFYYTITTDESHNGSLTFSGTIQDGHSKEPIEINGHNNSAPGLHHWADIDGDNRISDEEILEVYDLLANDDTQAPLDLDLVEEMWLGDGYVWQPELQQFSIIQ
jgi:transcriptional regulator with XRE-family HTH domain